MRHGVLAKERRELRVQDLASHRRFFAFHGLVLASTTVVSVVMDVAVQLVLLFHFGRDAHAAEVAPQESAVWRGIGFDRERSAARAKYHVRFVVQRF
ncbi:MAG: hypothetical protein Q7S01_04545 [bacterium]|nr:hypothetical protein [bacterium]